VQRQGDPTKYPAKVIAAGHECDLALLEVEDPNFMKDVTPLAIGNMPSLRDKVAAYGYPIGGDKLSITEGVVSRIEMGQYSHCWKTLPHIQIDAAINPGNSGGPVILEGKISGIAFQGMDQAENVGYMIPPPVIKHFLKDVEDSKYNGFPSLGLKVQELENPDHRASLGMKESQSGVVVSSVSYNTSSWGHIEVGDVILQVEGQTLANDGTVPFQDGERIFFSYFLVHKFIGDEASIKILRGGKEMEVTLPLKMSRPLVSACEFDVMPTYFIYGGMVFSPLSLNYLQSWGSNWWYVTPVHFRNHLQNATAEPDHQQVVVLQFVLADKANVGYHNIDNAVVKSVNGEKIVDMKDLVAKIEKAEGEFVEIETEGGDRLVFSRATAKDVTERVLKRYRIPGDRSDDLR